LKERWCILPKANAEFVWGMEDVLDVYHRPYASQHPLICMDESSKQQGSETRQPLPAVPGKPERDDDEYERQGVSNLFMFLAPPEGWRHVSVTDRRTKVDWAHGLKDLLTVHFPDAVHMTIVLDNLNTPHPASLYEAFQPEEAKALLDRCEFHYTPQHGSWLNMAEIELSAWQRQCLDRRIPDQATLRAEVAAWEQQRNAQRIKGHWRFTTADARIRLERL
jgi:DDE superfamily endonuclease